MTQTLDDYAFTIHLDVPYEDARERAETALKEQGFGVVTEIDMRATMRQKLDTDFRKYAILGACDPKLALRALSSEPQIGLLLPCNVVVYEDDGDTGSTVAIVDPMGMLGGIDTAELRAVADDARARLSKVAEVLSR